MKSDMALWYRQPAHEWVEALPIGNGRLGAMIYGGVDTEVLQFNEDTLWTGGPHEYQHEGAAQHLERIRELLRLGHQQEAQELASREFMSVPLTQKAYQPFGDVVLEFKQHSCTDYQRGLDLARGIASVSYKTDEGTYRRTYFSSHPDQLLVARLTTTARAGLSVSVGLRSPHKQSQVRVVDGDTVVLSGGIADGVLRFESRLKVLHSGGRITVDGDRVTLVGARSATLLLAARTSFRNYRDVSADPASLTVADLNRVLGRSWTSICRSHQRDHAALMGRVKIDLGSDERSGLPTDERLRLCKARSDAGLEALYFQYGRYLLIASSRPGDQPANLQGIWNDQMNPPWDSKWTVNINTEMNYWPAEVTNLPECVEPLVEMVRDCSVTGQAVARAHYDCPGWVLHHNTDLWRGTAPINGSDHGIWVTGGAWLCRHLWEHYRFTGDMAFLRDRAYPVMREASRFFTKFLTGDPSTGYLISTPSNSPENGGLVAGPTMDHQIIRTLLADTAEAARTLAVDASFADELDAVRDRIAPNQIGRHGQLQEWLADIDDPRNDHRHVSHLWGVYPGDEITAERTPELLAAARQSLLFRGDGGTGWSKAWKISLWARFKDGNHSHKMLSEALSGNTYPNLFDAHPPFQIDGNFGGTAGMAEMLVQSHADAIELLPALPSAWPSGSVVGLRVRGAYGISIRWRKGSLVQAVITANKPGRISVRWRGRTVTLNLQPGSTMLGPTHFGDQPQPL